jgi:hypothetical protein
MEQSGNRACARARPESGRRTWGLILTEREGHDEDEDKDKFLALGSR